MGIYIKDFKMPEGGYRTIEIAYDADGYPMAIADGGDVFDVILADDVLPRDEAIKMGAELAAIHGSDATSQQLEEAYFKGVEDGMTRRNVRPVVHGHWISQQWDGYGLWCCSECGNKYIYPLNFCSHCGADMRPELLKEE